ncbi:hypothetical protein B0T21DRAFT_406907 [Apiosordaria backusii]|uniref:Uncharacterized protein n=1 Tax=Apiosordaria backusii TaxID=314023 RepID=A0AA40K739_9PEZI|nr:hypothetical protein B0T21DRAFT_406907 [Apiosordaria backusii]
MNRNRMQMFGLNMEEIWDWESRVGTSWAYQAVQYLTTWVVWGTAPTRFRTLSDLTVKASWHTTDAGGLFDPPSPQFCLPGSPDAYLVAYPSRPSHPGSVSAVLEGRPRPPRLLEFEEEGGRLSRNTHAFASHRGQDAGQVAERSPKTFSRATTPERVAQSRQAQEGVTTQEEDPLIGYIKAGTRWPNDTLIDSIKPKMAEWQVKTPYRNTPIDHVKAGPRRGNNSRGGWVFMNGEQPKMAEERVTSL